MNCKINDGVEEAKHTHKKLHYKKHSLIGMLNVDDVITSNLSIVPKHLTWLRFSKAQSMTMVFKFYVNKMPLLYSFYKSYTIDVKQKTEKQT